MSSEFGEIMLSSVTSLIIDYNHCKLYSSGGHEMRRNIDLTVYTVADQELYCIHNNNNEFILNFPGTCLPSVSSISFEFFKCKCCQNQHKMAFNPSRPSFRQLDLACYRCFLAEVAESIPFLENCLHLS